MTFNFVVALLASIPNARAYLTQGKTVTMSSTLMAWNPDASQFVSCEGQFAVDNSFEAVWWHLMAWTHPEVNPWLNIALG